MATGVDNNGYHSSSEPERGVRSDGAGRRAVVLLSGGLDSATTLAIARDMGHECVTLALDYGQRHRHELNAAAAISRTLGAERHTVVSIDLRAIGGSALTSDIEVPKRDESRGTPGGIPVTYVPARNLVFLSLAVGYAETLGAGDVFIGVNAIDYSGYPDCRSAFIESFQRTAALATKAGVEGRAPRVRTPLIELTKAEIIGRGHHLGVDYGMTHSCYDPNEQGAACGRCDSCLLRKQGFADAGVPDPTDYA